MVGEIHLCQKHFITRIVKFQCVVVINNNKKKEPLIVGFIIAFKSCKASALLRSSPTACSQDRPQTPLPFLCLCYRDRLQFHAETSTLQQPAGNFHYASPSGIYSFNQHLFSTYYVQDIVGNEVKSQGKCNN